jgi:hypothetical protein
MKSNWIQLSEGIYFFGAGGINRIEPLDKRNGVQTPYNTVLYCGNERITVVKETEEEIAKFLKPMIDKE